MSKDKIKSVYIKLLIAAIILYVINTTFLLSDLYRKVGNIEHALIHMDKGHVYHE